MTLGAVDHVEASYILREELPRGLSLPFKGDLVALHRDALELAYRRDASWAGSGVDDPAVLWAYAVARAARRIYGRTNGLMLVEALRVVVEIAGPKTPIAAVPDERP